MQSAPFLANAAQIRKADQVMIDQYDFPGLLLMEAAGKQSADWILARFPAAKRYVVLAGPGNNGGDGLVIARFLAQANKNVTLIHTHAAERYTGDAAINWKALKGAQIDMLQAPCAFPNELLEAPKDCVVIDALLGTGIQAAPTGQIAELIAAFQAFEAPIVAIDLPSGLDADSGFVIEAPLKAQATLTFQVAKLCHWIEPAAAFCGEIVCLDIGIWPAVMGNLGIQRHLLTAEFCRNLLHERAADGHKGSFGHALAVGGSLAFPGAIALTGMAALQIGAGLASIFTTTSARCAIYEGRPELMVKAWGEANTAWFNKAALPALAESIRGKAALAVGPGMGNEAEGTDFMKGLLEMWPRPMVIDADGLNQIGSEPELWRYVPQGSILTPHPGEMRRLLPGFDVLNRRLEAAEKLSQQKQVIVVLKGKGTIVAFPNGKTYVNPTGNEGMGTGGAGDVLTGVLLGLLAQGYSPMQASLLGVFIHGLAGDLCAEAVGATEAVTASGILGMLGKALQHIRQEK